MMMHADGAVWDRCMTVWMAAVQGRPSMREVVLSLSDLRQLHAPAAAKQ